MMIYRKRKDRAFTMVEILVVVSIMALAFTFIAQMITSGSKNVTLSVWRADRLKESEFFFKRLRDDLHAASPNIDINYNNVGNELSSSGNSIVMYKEASGGSVGFNNPFASDLGISGAGGPHTVNMGKAANQKILSFTINKMNIKGNAALNSAGYSVKVNVYLVDTAENGRPPYPQLFYEKLIVSGDATAAANDGNLMQKKAVLNDVEYIYIAHKNINSQLNPAEVISSMLYIYIGAKDQQDGLKTAYFSQAIKSSLEAKSLSAL